MKMNSKKGKKKRKKNKERSGNYVLIYYRKRGSGQKRQSPVSPVVPGVALPGGTPKAPHRQCTCVVKKKEDDKSTRKKNPMPRKTKKHGK
jgi:hypothetical protein